MADYFSIHPENPQRRSIAQVAERMRRGAVVVYPTDSVYAIGCHIGDKQALDRIRQLRQLDKNPILATNRHWIEFANCVSWIKTATLR